MTLLMPYVAALIDNIAALATRNADGTILPVVAIHTPNLPLLRELADMTGVGTSEIRRGYDRVLCTEHCVQPHLHVDSVSMRWMLTGAKATIVLHTVAPHTRFRTERILELVDIGTKAPLKMATIGKMRKLGWSIPEWSTPSMREMANV